MALTGARQAWEQNVATLGAPAVWTQGADVFALPVVGFSVPRDVDPAIANALGVGVRMVTIRAVDTLGRTPRPLDRLDVGTEELTLDYVTPVMLAGELFGWRCYSAGTGTQP